VITTSNLGTTADCAGQYEWEVPTPSDNCAMISYTVTYANPDGFIKIEYCSANNQVADIFTKPV
jgi:hypothetical protein